MLHLSVFRMLIVFGVVMLSTGTCFAQTGSIDSVELSVQSTPSGPFDPGNRYDCGDKIKADADASVTAAATFDTYFKLYILFKKPNGTLVASTTYTVLVDAGESTTMSLALSYVTPDPCESSYDVFVRLQWSDSDAFPMWDNNKLDEVTDEFVEN